MIGHRLLHPEEVAAALEPLGCYWCSNLDERTQLWLTPWGFGFTIPTIGDDRMCPQVVVFEVLADIERTRPG